MPAVNLKLPVMEKGATYRFRFHWLNPPASGNVVGAKAKTYDDYIAAGYTPTDLSGCTAKLQVFDDDSKVVFVASTENGILTIDLNTAAFSLFLSDQDTANQPGEGGAYALFVRFPGGDTVKLIKGFWTFE